MFIPPSVLPSGSHLFSSVRTFPYVVTMFSNAENSDLVSASAYGAVQEKDPLAWICKST